MVRFVLVCGCLVYALMATITYMLVGLSSGRVFRPRLIWRAGWTTLVVGCIGTLAGLCMVFYADALDGFLPEKAMLELAFWGFAVEMIGTVVVCFSALPLIGVSEPPATDSEPVPQG